MQIAAYGIPDDAANNQGTPFSARRWTTTPSAIAGTTSCSYGGLRLRSAIQRLGADRHSLRSLWPGISVLLSGSAGYAARRQRLHHHARGNSAGRDPYLAAARASDLSVRRRLSAAVVVPHQHQLRLCANRLSLQREAHGAVRISLHQRRPVLPTTPSPASSPPTATTSAT